MMFAQAGEGGLLILFVAWVVLGPLVGHAIGKPKGHAGTGVVLGLLFGVFGWIVVALLAPAPGFSDTGPQGAMRTCPHCAEDIKFAAVVCRFCGRDVDPVDLGPGTTSDGVPIGWAMSWQDYQQVERRFPGEVEKLRSAAARHGHPALAAKHVRMAITDIKQGLTGEAALARWGKANR